MLIHYGCFFLFFLLRLSLNFSYTYSLCATEEEVLAKICMQNISAQPDKPPPRCPLGISEAFLLLVTVISSSFPSVFFAPEGTATVKLEGRVILSATQRGYFRQIPL